MLDPVQVALDAAIPGGATVCTSVHLGEIRPGGMRGNHMHYTCNEALVIWGAKTKFKDFFSRLGNSIINTFFKSMIRQISNRPIVEFEIATRERMKITELRLLKLIQTKSAATDVPHSTHAAKKVEGDQQLRALEFNSWKLLRLLQLPGISSCSEHSNDLPTQTSTLRDQHEEMETFATW